MSAPTVTVTAAVTEQGEGGGGGGGGAARGWFAVKGGVGRLEQPRAVVRTVWIQRCDSNHGLVSIYPSCCSSDLKGFRSSDSIPALRMSNA